MIKVALIPNDFYVADKGFEAVIALCAEENVHHIERNGLSKTKPFSKIHFQ